MRILCSRLANKKPTLYTYSIICRLEIDLFPLAETVTNQECQGYQPFLSIIPKKQANDAAVTTCIPGYTSIWGLDLQSYQIHARCILLDTRTGYRSQFFAVSGVVSL